MMTSLFFLAIMLVGVVYVTLLRGLLDLSGGAKLADTLMHYATPVLVPLWWLLFAPKGKLEWRDPAIWSLFPLAYFPYALARGAYEGIYAYPFINVAKIGWTQVGINAVMIAGGFLVPLGQSTLYVFVMHVFFALAVASIPVLTRGDLLLDTLANVVVLALLWVMVRTRFLFAVVPR